MTQANLIYITSQISVWICEEVGSIQGELIVWYLKNGTEIVLDTDKMILGIYDSKLDNKTWFALAALAQANNLEIIDGYTEKPSKTKK